MSEAVLKQRYPVGAIDTRASGWWAMIFVVVAEGALFGYLLFSYYYFASQAHTIGYFPPGGLPLIKLSGPDTAILLLSSVAVSFAQMNIKRDNNARLVAGLGIGALLGIIFLIIQYFEWRSKPFSIASHPYGSLFFLITGFHMAHVFVGVIILLCLFVWSWVGYFNRYRYAHVHIGALYWHFVDAVWLTIFFTFYITPRIA